MSVSHETEENFGLFQRDVEKLAKRLRTEALSGYRWNVPAKWENAHWIAQERWLAKARDLIVQKALTQ